MQAEKLGWLKSNEKFKVFDPLVDILNFPQLSKQSLKQLFTGTYQLSLAASYLCEQHAVKKFLQIAQDNNILKCKVKSRHSSGKFYQIFIQYNPDDSENPFDGWYCTCANGARTIG